ncbi:GNAT family N-acetyltransferase [Pontivivens ytuae]|uniref:GNAT family N-acetyltransferase n=1 Tax=Pontivivens ytuae TaxID=2789856 RepID=A0A7S9LPR7_9RHOB|nr:GNAT family N-acetyltransferase [Pontivivens ytuae]QPH52856.1 GNAT family N-acetyltransferase [Pontivivens ytuae]
MTPPIRPASPEDAATIARIHVESWHETYTGLIPNAFLDQLDVARSTAFWTKQIAAPGASRILIAGEVAFANAGPMRDDGLRAAGCLHELYALYILKSGQRRGLGTALFTTALEGLDGDTGLWVLEDNHAARRFYTAIGAARIPGADKDVPFGEATRTELAYRWASSHQES